MTESYTRPNFLEISNHFLRDAIDFEIRYKFCINSDGPLFSEPRSRLLKVFLDLRMGIESAIKALGVYFASKGRSGKSLINWVEGYKHKIEKIFNDIVPFLPIKFSDIRLENCM